MSNIFTALLNRPVTLQDDVLPCAQASQTEDFMDSALDLDDVPQVPAFIAENPEVFQWIDSKKDTLPFAKSLREYYDRRGFLTPGQLSAVRNCLARAEQRAAAPALNTRQLAIDSTALEQAFTKAKDAGVKRPRVKLGAVLVSTAPANGRNPGALYVTNKEHGTYLGKIVIGCFTRSAECSEEAAQEVQALLSDPRRTIEAYGQRTGYCAICARLLTDEESVKRGIGPICAERFGW